MQGPWLRNSQANILTAAMMTAAVLIWPFPANTSVYSPVPILEPAPAVTETVNARAVRTPDAQALRPEHAVQSPSDPAFMQIAMHLTPREPVIVPQTVPEQHSEHASPARPSLMPNLFGTVTQRVSYSPQGWVEHVSEESDDFDDCLAGRTNCGSRAATWADEAARLAAMPLRQRLASANVFVNSHIRYRSDLSATGQIDSWMTPAQLFATSSGDCEDYALAKYWLLRAAGVPEEDMFVMIVNDLIVRADHAYLAVRVGDGFIILDSRADGLQTPGQIDDVRPIVSITASGAYLHGRRA